MSQLSRRLSLCFNPSIEGQPLQLVQEPLRGKLFWSFNPSIEGQPLQPVATAVSVATKASPVSIPLSRDSHCNKTMYLSIGTMSVCFNPSIEGQPLQPYRVDRLRCSGVSFQSLYRGTAIATEPLQRPWFPIVTIGCFSNLWLVFVF